MPVIDGKACIRCYEYIDTDVPSLCDNCQRITDGETALRQALAKLAENRAAEAIRIIEDALERLSP